MFNINTSDSAKSVDNVNQSLQNTQKSANNLGNALKKPFQIGSSAALAAKGMQLINTAAKNTTDAIKKRCFVRWMNMAVLNSATGELIQ